MTDIKFMVDAVKLLNQTWNEYSKDAEQEAPTDVYNAMCEIDEAVINLVEKIGLCVKAEAIVKMYGKSELANTHNAIVARYK